MLVVQQLECLPHVVNVQSCQCEPLFIYGLGAAMNRDNQGL